MFATLLSVLIVLFVGIACSVFNKPLSHRFAHGLAEMLKCVLPQQCIEQYFYVFFRAFFYIASLFCFAAVVFFTVLLIGNIN